MNHINFQHPLEEYKKVVGNENVLTDAQSLDDYGCNVSGLKRDILAIIKPLTTEEVQKVVVIANKFKTSLYPVSCGKNWGFGSRLPVRDGSIILDLGRMNRIQEVNVEHHYAVVEPGVSQGQLYDYLVQHELPLTLNVTGSSRDASLIGNALERGIGYFSSRADSLSGMEVVLGNGEILRTGYSHFPHAKTKHIYKYGIGPSLDGFFSQSNYGVVTSAGVDLIPKAEAHFTVIASLIDEKKLDEFVEAIATFKKTGFVQTVVHIGNKHRMEITLSPLIYKGLRDKQPHSKDLRKETEDFMKARSSTSWSAVIGVCGTRSQLITIEQEIKYKLRGLAKVLFITDRSLTRTKRMAQKFGFLSYFRQKKVFLEAIEPLYGLTKGIPTDAAIGSVYWAVGEMPPYNKVEPDQSPCGMLFCVPMMPLSGKFAATTTRRVEEIFNKHSFTPYVTLNILDAKTLEAVINVAFDRRKSDRVDAAHRCIDETQQYFFDEGLIPYRVGIQSMEKMIMENDPFWRLVRNFKEVLDPNHIIAPGRYNLV